MAHFDLSQHPAQLIQLIRLRYGMSVSFEFSRYYYRPRSLEDERETFHVPASHVTHDLVCSLITNLPEGYELALNSRVYISPNEYLHIPMIDCAAKRVEQLRSIYTVLPKETAASMYWYGSGRSFHGYGVKLLSNSEWIDFMGRLLLVNTPGHSAIVDPRWIGHRLMSGYSALRWSWNTPQYLHEPRFVLTWMGPSNHQLHAQQRN